MKRNLIFILALMILSGYTAAAETPAAAVWTFDRKTISVGGTTKGQWQQPYAGSDVVLSDDGFLGECANFVKTNDDNNSENVISLGTLPAYFNRKTDLTFSAWINPSTFKYNMTVFSITDENGDEVFNLCTENRKLVFYATKNYYSFSPTNENTINTDEWTHIAASVKMASNKWTVRIYINSVLAGETRNWGINIPRLKSAYNAYIGAVNRIENKSTRDFNGRIDEVKLYDKILTSAEISAEFENRTQQIYEKNNTPENIYVSTKGSDENGGTSAAPLKTLRAALNKAYLSDSDNVFIIMEKGEYTDENTVFLPPSDKKITVAAKEKGVVISGAKTVSDWTLYDASKNIFRAYAGDVDTNTFFVNKQRRQRAKTDNIPNYTYSDSGFSFSDTSFYGDSVLFYLRYDWRDRITPITKNGDYLRPLLSPIDNEYIVKIENSYSLLDEEGEWYYDKNDKYIYYKPLSGEDINSCTARIGTVDTLIKGIHSSNITFGDIDFFGTSWTEGDKTGFSHMQAGFCDDFGSASGKKISPSLDFIRCDGITLQSCKFYGMGGNGVWFKTGCTSCSITDSDFSDISASAVLLGLPNESAYDKNKTSVNNKILNNTIHNVGYGIPGTAAIFGAFTEKTVISHNEIYDCPYSGISIGYSWDNRVTAAKDNEISYNYIHDVMETMRDGAGIYSLGAHPGLQIRGNVICNLPSSFGGFIYLDNGSRYATVTHNIGYNASFAVYSKGSDHVITDNYFDNSYLSSIIGSQISGHGTNNYINNTVISDGNFPKTILNNAGICRTAVDDEIGKWEFDALENPQNINISGWETPDVGSDIKVSSDGVYGNSFEFVKTDSTTNYNNGISLGKLPQALDGVSEITVSAWINPKEYNYYMTIFSVTDENGNLVFRLSLENGYMCLYATSVYYSCLNTKKQTIPTNEWTHVALTMQMNKNAWNLASYINGEESEACNNWGIYHDGLSRNYNAYIGTERIVSGAATNDFSGKIDSLSLYGRRLTQGEIKNIYNKHYAQMLEAVSYSRNEKNLSVSIKNNSYSGTSAYAIAAAYDDNGKLVSCDAEKFDVPNTDEIAEVALKLENTGEYGKLMIFENICGILPLGREFYLR